MKLLFQKDDGGREQAFPDAKKKTGDCVIRAIAIGTGKPYIDVWRNLFSTALEIGMFPNTDDVCATFLESNQWKRERVGGKNTFRLSELPKSGTYICHVRKHWVAVIDGILYDTWDSRSNSHGKSNRVFSIFHSPNN